MDRVFEAYLQHKLRREETIKAYLQRFRLVADNVETLDAPSINNWLLERKKKGVQGNSLNSLVKAVRAYCRAHKLSWEKDVSWFVEEPTHKEIFSDSEIEAFLTLPKLPYFHPDIWDRWTLFFTILAYSGMRANEVASLTVSQIDFTSNNFILPVTKTNPRKVPIAVNILPLLTGYVPRCSNYLFPCDRGKLPHIWRSGWQKHFNVRKKVCGLSHKLKLTTHSFRHSHATNLYENGVELPDIMNIEGHKNYDTALKYIHLSNKGAQKAINKHSGVRKWLTPKEKFKLLIDEARKQGILDDEDFKFIIESDFFAIWEKGKKDKKLTFSDT